MVRLTVEKFEETCLKTIYPFPVTLQSSQEFLNYLGLDYFDVMGTILMPLVTTRNSQCTNRKASQALHGVHYMKLLAYSDRDTLFTQSK